MVSTATAARFLIRDRGSVPGRFDAVFTAEGIEILASPPPVLGGLTREYRVAA